MSFLFKNKAYFRSFNTFVKQLAILLLIVGSSQQAFAQFGLGDALKKKATNVIKEKLSEKAEEKNQSYDTLSFNYSIAFLDKSESFRNRQEGERLVKLGNYMLDDEGQKTPLEELRETYDMANISYVAGSLFIAEAYLQSIALQLIPSGTEGKPIYLKSLGLLGVIYNSTGRFKLAEEYTLEALEGWEAFQGKESVGYLAELNNLAVLRMNQGDYLATEDLMQQMKNPLLALKSESPLPYAIYLNNNAIFNQYMGRTNEALDFMNECIEASGTSLGESNTTYLQFLTNKAILQQENEKLEEAEITYNKVVKLQSSIVKSGKKGQNNLAHTEANLASLYVQKGEIDKAEKLLNKALGTLKDNKGVDDLQTASVQADLGALYRYQGKFTESKSLLDEALYTRERKLAKTHPLVIHTQEELALLNWQMGKIEQAQKLFSIVLDQSLDFIKNYFNALSEAEKTKYWESLKPRFYRYYNFALENYEQYPGLLDQLIKYRFTTKGVLLSSSTSLQNEILNGKNEPLKQTYSDWVDIKQQLATIYGMSDEEISEQKINVDSLEQQANLKEKQLNAQSSSFREVFENKNTSASQLMSKLSVDEVLIEVIQMPHFDKQLTSKSKYGFLIFDGANKKVRTVLIENGDQLEGRYFAYYNNVVKQKIVDQYSYAQYYRPISNLVQAKKRIYFSPDGIYNQLNLNTLRQADGKYLIQAHEILYIGHPNDLLNKQTAKNSSKATAFLLGNPDYGKSGIQQLPGTQEELDQIARYLSGNTKVEKFTQNNANEYNLKQAKSPHVLHLASHGFFMEDKEVRDNLFGVQVQYLRQNPLLRSGLLLSGARTADESNGSNQSFNDSNNGVFTAYEAISLDLSQTDLVVLSACETGKGDIKAGEGVYGLQRAFIIAGARSIVMSMWKVDDEATKLLMTYFYKNRLKEIPVEAAFRNAQLQLMSSYKDPYYWGAFMMFSQ